MKELQIRHFRNLGFQDLEVPPEGVAIVGENAHGKSNLLEAVYYLETFRSFRGARDDELVGFGHDLFRLVARLEDPYGGNGRMEVTAAYERKGGRRVTVDGAERARMGEALGRLAAVIFSPGDVAIVSEGPGERRRFLDVLLSLNVRTYLDSLQRYRQALSQRNALLKDERPPQLVEAWNEPLVDAGSSVIEARRSWIGQVGKTFSAYYEAVAPGERSRLEYQPSVALEGAEGREQVAEAFRAELRRSSPQERRVRATVVGPHRDEMGMTIEAQDGALDIRRFGSGGQRRTAALALRLVEAETVRASRGREPVVLLDDVFAELDAPRSERMLALIEREETGQVILTAPKESEIRVRRESLPRWRIECGRISA